MPKVKLNEITEVSKESIEKELLEIESLLEGRIDIDNLRSNASGTVSVGKSSFADLADYASPIYADKFFGQTDSDLASYPDYAVDFYEDVFQNLLLKSWQSDVYTVLTQKVTMTLNYKNQENLEKPNITMSDTSLSLEQQRLAIEKYNQKLEAARLAWEIENSQPESFLQTIGSFFLGGVTGSLLGGAVGFIAGMASAGPVGAAIGGIAGAFAGGTAGSIIGLTPSIVANRPGGSFDTSYSSHSANTQIVIFRHPPNFKMVSMLEVTDHLTDLLEDDVDYVRDWTIYNRKKSSEKIAVSVRVSTENELENEKAFYTIVDEPFAIDAETTAVAFTVTPYTNDMDLITASDTYITALAEIDILFKETT